MTPENQEIYDTWIKLNTLLTKEGHPTDPRKLREVIASIVTNCETTKEKSGPDCYWRKGQQRLPAERKSTFDTSIKAAYTGLSLQKTWELQKEYLVKKIKEIPRHYIDLFCRKTGKVLKSYYLTGDEVFDIILPQVYVDFHNPNQRADPRLKGRLSEQQIYDHGKKVI